MIKSNEQMVTLDLTGKQCPMNFVYTKLALEELLPGQVLQVVLDHPPAFANVPRSVRLQELGEIIEETDAKDGKKSIRIRKTDKI